MSRRHLGGVAAAALVGAALASLPHSAAAAAPTHGQNARALAATSARNLIASRAPALKISGHDGFKACPSSRRTASSTPPYDAHLPRPARHRRRLRRRDRRRGPGPGHLGRADPQGRPDLGHPAVAKAARGRATAPAAGPPRDARTPRHLVVVAARRDAPGSPGRPRSPATTARAVDQGRRRRRPHRRVLQARSTSSTAPATGNWEGTVTIPTTRLRHVVLDDRTATPPRSSARTPPATRPSPGPTTCGATASRPTARPAASTRSTSASRRARCCRRWLRPQRHERLRRLGADPGRPQRRQRLLRRHPGPDRPHPDQRQVDRRRSTCVGPRVRPRRRRPHPGRHLGRRHPGVRRRHLRRRDRVVRQQPGRHPRLHRRRGGQPGRLRARSATCTTRPLAGDPNCYSSSIPSERGARGGRPRQPLVLPAGRGHQPDQRPADQPDLQQLVGDRHRHPEGPADHVQRDADEDDARRRT